MRPPPFSPEIKLPSTLSFRGFLSSRDDLPPCPSGLPPARAMVFDETILYFHRHGVLPSDALAPDAPYNGHHDDPWTGITEVARPEWIFGDIPESISGIPLILKWRHMNHLKGLDFKIVGSLDVLVSFFNTYSFQCVSAELHVASFFSSNNSNSIWQDMVERHVRQMEASDFSASAATGLRQSHKRI